MRTLFLAGLALVLAAPAAAPVTAAPGGPASQCRGTEKTVYSCSFGKAVGSVCAGGGAIHYRYGPLGRPALDIASDRNWSNVHTGTVIGGGGGSQKHLRFSRGNHNYVVFWGTAGSLTDVPGKQWSGIQVSRGNEVIARLDCKRAARPAPNWDQILRDSLPRHLDEVPEENDPQFDGWF